MMKKQFIDVGFSSGLVTRIEDYHFGKSVNFYKNSFMLFLSQKETVRKTTEEYRQ
jgi:hypothetical protein